MKYSKEYEVKRKKNINHGLFVKSIVEAYYNSRWQIDLVDDSLTWSKCFTKIYPVQDNLTKFIHFEVAEHFTKKESFGK